jgi:hypothetical protein
MNNILSFYTKYRNNVPNYNEWNNSKKKELANSSSCDAEILKKKAKTIAEPILVLDSYEHEKAEDSETFFQTYNIELLSLTGVLSSLPIAATKLIPILNKYSDKSSIIKNISSILTKYKDTSINIKGKQVSLPKIAALFSSIGSGIFYVSNMKKSMQDQLGLIRKASFDATQEIINDPKYFAVLTEKQEEEINSITNYSEKSKSAFVDKLKDKMDINSSFKSLDYFKKSQKSYEIQKENYFKDIENKKNPSYTNKAIQDQKLLQSYLTNVEHDSLKELQKIETVSNITYSSLFTGGFLEYLISDKLVEVLGVKNKPLKAGLKFGVPLLTYLLLNKNISDIENKAILATKYKHLKKFIQDPTQYEKPSDETKMSPSTFIKTVLQDMKDYEKFSQEEMPKLKEKMEFKKNLQLSKSQEDEAKQLQQNTSMAINTQREKLYEQSVGIKALSETILGPLDVLSTAIGGKIGHNLSKKCSNKKLSGVLTGLGAVIAFIPAAIVEAKLTKQQKLSEKIAAMLAIEELNDTSKFNQQTNEQTNSDKNPLIFKEFIN